MKNDILEELQSRREFFKKATQKCLPMFGLLAAGPMTILSALTSCSKENLDGCSSCSNTCIGGCLESCSGSCAGTSQSSGCSSCANDCSSSCKEACANDCSSSCKGTCSNTCEGSATGKSTKGTINGHEYVDLGLSVLWATCSIGAITSEDKGQAFPYVHREWLENNTGDERATYVQKFSSLNIQPGTSIYGTNLDTAHDIWGDEWRLPSGSEIDELIGNCDGKRILGVGFRFTSRINGESILFTFPDTNGLSDWIENGVYSIFWSGDTVAVDASMTKDHEYLVLGAKCLNLDNSAGEASIINNTIAYIDDNGFNRVNRACFRPVVERSNGNVSSCNGNCTANCSNDCTSTCKNQCSDTCKGGCGNSCEGGCKDGCQDGCKTTCTKTCADSCSSNCTGKCTQTCADACKGQTSQYCSNCASNCSSGCTKTCADSCKAETSQGCSNCSTQCSGDCNHECTYGCGRQCHISCGGQCKGKCGGSCQVECTSYAKNNPCSSCGGTCKSACNENCTYDCYSTCTSVGYM